MHERVDVRPLEMPAGRLAGAVARQPGGIPYPEGGGRVEGDALSQIAGMVEPPVADPGTLLQGMEEPLDAPAKLMPAQQRLGALKAGLALSAERHPVERLLLLRWQLRRQALGKPAKRRAGRCQPSRHAPRSHSSVSGEKCRVSICMPHSPAHVGYQVKYGLLIGAGRHGPELRHAETFDARADDDRRHGDGHLHACVASGERPRAAFGGAGSGRRFPGRVRA